MSSPIPPGWFGAALRWERNDAGLWTTVYRGRSHSVVKLTSARAAEALSPPGWYFTEQPRAEVVYPGRYGRMLGPIKQRALVVAEAVLIVDPADQEHGEHAPGLLGCLGGGSTFAAFDGRTVTCQMVWGKGELVLLDLSGQQRKALEIGRIRPELRLAGTRPDQGVLVDWHVTLTGDTPSYAARSCMTFHGAVGAVCWYSSATRTSGR